MKSDIRLRVYHEQPFFGNGVAQLLDGVEKYGSLKAAYQDMGMSSSKAWKILSRAEADLGHPLTESVSGGAVGGKTVLSAFGKDFLERYHRVMSDVQQTLQESMERNFPQ